MKNIAKKNNILKKMVFLGCLEKTEPFSLSLSAISAYLIWGIIPGCIAGVGITSRIQIGKTLS
jgi:hypothetical protein